MDHGGHGGHGGHDMPMIPTCKMNMLWNTDIIDTCIVFRSWHISTHTAFFFSCLAIVALGVFYEYLRVYQRKFDQHLAASLAAAHGKGRSRSNSRGRTAGVGGLARHDDDEGNDLEESAGLLSGRVGRWLNSSLTGVPVPFVSRITRAVLYGSTVFLSFFLMLVFMTYNAYLIAATVFGAALGHFIFGSTLNVDAILGDSTSGKGMACH